MPHKDKPNFVPPAKNKSGPQGPAADPSKPRPSKSFDKAKDHHGPLKGGNGNNTGNNR